MTWYSTPLLPHHYSAPHSIQLLLPLSTSLMDSVCVSRHRQHFPFNCISPPDPRPSTLQSASTTKAQVCPWSVCFFKWSKKKKKTERGKDTSAQTKLGLWQLAYVLQKLVEWQRRLNLNVGEEQVTGLEETRKRREGRRTRLESYRFVIHCSAPVWSQQTEVPEQ